MPDLQDGETVEIKGSARAPYVLKNTGGVYSCSCPAWRNQSVGIERRTCKHLRKYRGEQAEQDRIGGPLPEKSTKPAGKAEAPPLLLAHSWENEAELNGWWMSEKLDGVRAYWDGQQFLSRLGNKLHAPDWFVAGLPSDPLDGELWLDRKAFQRTVSIVRRQDQSDHWKEITFVTFDAPAVTGGFEARLEFLQATFADRQPEYARVLQQDRCRGLEHLQEELTRIESLGGEGLMLREPGSAYEAGRSTTLLKVKSFHDAEARVVDHVKGKGRHKGRMGALAVKLPDGTSFSVGTGFSDAQRDSPPPIGSVITFRYQELTDGGVPRFPSFIRGHQEAPGGNESSTQTAASKTSAARKSAAKVTDSASTRYFEYVGGSSSKFWEISIAGCDVTVRYGRIGADGQSSTKTLGDEVKALQHAEKLIASKTDKGYQETTAT
ncbi:MAG: DNA ligase [Pirellulales bacterium]